MLSRRRFWSYAAPAIVLAPNIMRVSMAALESLPSPAAYVTGYDSISFSDLVTAAIRRHHSLIYANVEKKNALWQHLVGDDTQPS